MDDVPNLIIIGWLLFCAGLLLIIPREMSPHSKLYRSKKRFLKQHKEYVQIVKYFELFRILWIIGSFVAMAILMQEHTAGQWGLFVLLVPAVGVGIVQSLLEIRFGLSLQVGADHNSRIIRIGPMMPRLKRYPSWYMVHETKFKRVGQVRLALNLFVLVSLFFFL